MKKPLFLLTYIVGLFGLLVPPALTAQVSGEISLENGKARLTVEMEEGHLLQESFSLLESSQPALTNDGGFELLVTWTGWRAPGKDNNGDVNVSLNKNDFRVASHALTDNEKGDKILLLRLEGVDNDFLLDLTYLLQKDKNYYRKMLHVTDTIQGTHFLRKISPVHAEFKENMEIVKDGGFGQPVALAIENGSAFIGLEYPASEQKSRAGENGLTVMAEQYIGEKIDLAGIRSDWAVVGLAPHPHVKLAFMEYLEDVRIAPAEPYTLYNSWYDLRSTEYPGVDPANHMNEENVMRMIRLIRENMIEKHGIRLDAFVLDDGWDIYESDWVLREKEFPGGLKPVADKLSETGTDLGIWYGPTGGYSFRMKRIDWMRQHGYETVGEEKTWHSEMLCLAGKNYSDLFRKRTSDMVKEQGVGYFKWDGIQFSCSEQDHGHSVGIYSRRDVIRSVIDKCEAVRAIDPDVYLNITSGTWLSPWWLKYANQIWMDGGDYGWASVPSYNKRDAAITYRDQVLYEDFHKKDLWFPISNLMTHGIIKGNLQKLGGDQEPIDKFTDNALLYFARGVTMWELYISPDILNEDEWEAISGSIRWAKDRSGVLSNTFMIGGDPSERQPYGYVHFQGNRGVVALRNPSFEALEMTFHLDGAYGLSEDAQGLVLHKTYPFQWISSSLYDHGDKITVGLDAYETLVFEIYPLEEVTSPILANAVFTVQQKSEKNLIYQVFEATGPVKFLNPGTLPEENEDLLRGINSPPELVLSRSVSYKNKGEKNILDISFETDESMVGGTLAMLIEPGFPAEDKDPEFTVTLDGTMAETGLQRQDGMWAWITLPVTKGRHEVTMTLPVLSKAATDCQVWLFAQQVIEPTEIHITSKEEVTSAPMPPAPLPEGIFRRNVKLGNVVIER